MGILQQAESFVGDRSLPGGGGLLQAFEEVEDIGGGGVRSRCEIFVGSPWVDSSKPNVIWGKAHAKAKAGETSHAKTQSTPRWASSGAISSRAQRERRDSQNAKFRTTRLRGLINGCSYAPESSAPIVGDQHRAICQQGHSDRAPVDLGRLLVGDESGQEVFDGAGGLAVVEADKSHLVTDKVRAVPRAVHADESAALITARERFVAVEG